MLLAEAGGDLRACSGEGKSAARSAADQEAGIKVGVELAAAVKSNPKLSNIGRVNFSITTTGKQVGSRNP